MLEVIRPDDDRVVLQLSGLLQSAERDAVRGLTGELRRRLQGAQERADAYGHAVGSRDLAECALAAPRPLRSYFQAAAEERVLGTLLTVLDAVGAWQAMGQSTAEACSHVGCSTDTPDSAA